MKKKIIKQYRVARIVPANTDNKKEKKTVKQLEDYVSYYELFKSLEK
jgi:hypothetical protein